MSKDGWRKKIRRKKMRAQEKGEMSWWRVLMWVFLIGLTWWTFTVAGEVAKTTKEGSEPAKIEGRAAKEAKKEAPTERREQGCSFKRTYHPDRKDLSKMPFGAKGQQDVGVACNGTLKLDISFAQPGWDWIPSNVSVAMTGGRVYLYHVRNSNAPPTDPDQIAAVTAWQALRNPPEGMDNALYFWAMWAIEARVPGDPPSSPVIDVEYVVAGWQAYDHPGHGPPYSNWEWLGPAEIEEDFAISLSGAYRRAAVTDPDPFPAGQSGLRHPAQRTGEGKWYGDENTLTLTTIGNCSANGNYQLASETELDMGIAVYMDYARLGNVGQGYAWATVNGGPVAGGVGVNFASWTFYIDIDSAGQWIWRGTSHDPAYSEPRSDANTYWKTVPTGNTITIYRCAGAVSGGVSWEEGGYPRAKGVVPRLWKQNKDATGVSGGYYRYDTYNTSAGHPFDIGLFHHWVGGVQETDAEVSVAPLFSGYYEYSELWSFGVPVPDDVWRKFANLGNGFECKLRKDWLVVNDEIGSGVLFTNPITTHDLNEENMIDIRVPCTFHNLQGSLTAAPWSSDWMTWERLELNLDKPDGTNRPSAWFPCDDGSVEGELWRILAADGGVQRRLASRREWRYDRINAHLWTGHPLDDKQEVTYNWLLMTRANLPIGLTLDDPDWWLGVNGWTPSGSYSIGRIDTYEGVDCSGECDQFTQRFFEAKWTPGFPSNWYMGILSEQYASLPLGVTWHPAEEGPPLAGDMLLLSNPWTPLLAHSGICHSVAGATIYYANSNHGSPGNGLGYFGTVDGDGCELIGSFRYSPGVAFEDRTDWRMFSKVALRFIGVEVDQRVAMTLHYQTISGYCPRYIGAAYCFSADTGAAEVTLSELKTATIEGTLHASDGIVWFDLCPDCPDAPLDLCYVSRVEFFFEAPCELTFVSWLTVPYASGPYGTTQAEVMDRIVPKHSTDYFGARAFVDGMPNYKPDYLYVLDTEGVEVGYKNCDDAQHDPEYTGDPDDPRSLKSLAQFYNEQSWAETVAPPTWYQTNVDHDLMDEDDAVLGTPVWGDYDEDGFALHVGKDLDVTFPISIVYCDFILQGGARGVAKIGGVRQVSREAGVKLYYSDDILGTTKTLIREVGTGWCGEFRVGAGRQKMPRRYWLNDYSIGAFANVEEVWHGVTVLGIGYLHLAYHPVSGELLLTDVGFFPGGGVGQTRIRNGPGWSERVVVPDSEASFHAVTVAHIYGSDLIEGDIIDGAGVFGRKQTDLLGQWDDQVELALSGGRSWPMAMEYQDRLLLVARALRSGSYYAVLDHLKLNTPYTHLDPAVAPIIGPTDALTAPWICVLTDYWRLVAGVVRDGNVELYDSVDGGQTWTQREQVPGIIHPTLCSVDKDVFASGYVADSYGGAQGRVTLSKVKVRGETWTVEDAVLVGSCDEGRPVVYVDPNTRTLRVLAPKVTTWALSGASPAVVEYVSKDMGKTFETGIVHEVA